MHAGQLSRGDGYDELCRSVVVLILGFRELKGERFHSLFRVREVHDSEELSEQLEIHVLELPKLRTAANSDGPELVEWGKFLAARSDAEREELAMKNPDLRQAKVALERLSADPDARILAEMRDRAVKSYRLDINKARKEGRVEGIKEGQAALLTDLLSVKFGPLPAAVVERLLCATEGQLLGWARKLVVAESLDGVFGDD
jgi:predicted transposase/invertase (TIGR01784 family)